MIVFEKWLDEAKRYAEHAYCYGGMVPEFPEFFANAFAQGDDPYKAVDDFGDDGGLDRQDGFYGINSDKKFVKAEGCR
jgi:hypothetical protein